MTTGSSTNSAPDDVDLEAQLAQAQRALRASEQRETHLRRELEHRVRNVLAVSRSILARTLATATSVESARSHLSGRLDALARYQGRTVAMLGADFDLETMIWDELLAVASAGDPRIVVDGPSTEIAPQVAEVIGLALHELVTNSVKFGVLAGPSAVGKLAIEWRVHSGEIDLHWSESGVPIVSSAPLESGFGQDYIEHALPYQLGATTSFELVPGGMRCRMLFLADTRG